MKKFLLSIFAVLFAFAGVQAEEVTFDFKELYGTTTLSSIESKTVSGITVSYEKNDASSAPAYNKDGTMRLYYASTGNGGSATFTTDGTKKITKVVITATTTPTVKYCIDDITTANGTWNSKIMTISNIEATKTFEIQNANTSNTQLRISSIVFTCEEIGGGETPDVPVVETVKTPTITAESNTFNEGESLFVTIETETEDAQIYYTLNGNEPSADNGELYKGKIELTKTTTVKAIAVKEDWNDSEVAEATFTAINPNGGSFELVASELGIANGVAVESLTFGNVTATFDKGTNSNAPKYYTTGAAIRAYGGNTITFAGAVGVTITGIEMTFASGEGTNAITADCGTFSTNAWTGSSNKVVLTIGGASGHRRIATIKVTYSIDKNVVVIATPSITASTSFVGSTTVEITNNEEGTTLFYSTNGENYVAYTEALNITETTTVYAKAVDAQGNESAVAEATYTKIEVLSIAEAKAAYDANGEDVDVAVDLTGAVVTVNNGLYLFIENGTTGINIYNSGADYAEGTKFTAGYILGTSTTYRNMHQLSSVKFCGVETTTTTVEPLEVAIADIAGNYEEYEGRFVKLTGVSIDADKNMAQGDDEYKAYDRFALGFGAIANCDVTGVVAIYNTGEQLYIKDITYNLSVSAAEYATLFLDFNATIPAGVEAYVVKSTNNGYAQMEKVESVLPANTGVIVKAAKGEYTFAYSTGTLDAVEGNLLEGTAAATYINVEAYVLGKVGGEVGLYKAQMTDGEWLNNANKAYLPASVASGAAYYSFRFGEGTTGVENVEVENTVNVIYDLTGRRVEAITAPGIYIVNGKKTLVK